MLIGGLVLNRMGPACAVVEQALDVARKQAPRQPVIERAHPERRLGVEGAAEEGAQMARRLCVVAPEAMIMTPSSRRWGKRRAEGEMMVGSAGGLYGELRDGRFRFWEDERERHPDAMVEAAGRVA